MDIEQGDNLNWVKHTDGTQEIMLVTEGGMSIRFEEATVPERSRTAGGVRGIELRDQKTKVLADRVVSMGIATPTSQLLVCSTLGFGKRTDLTSYRSQKKGGRGLITMACNTKTGKIVDAAVVEPNERLMVLTESGVMIRMEIMTIRSISRSTQGVKLINLGDGDRVTAITNLLSTEDLEMEAEAELAKTE